MEWIAIVVFALIGGVIGSMLIKLIFPTKPIGTLRIDTSDRDGPYLFLELDKPIGEFYKDSYVTMKVSTENYISQE